MEAKDFDQKLLWLFFCVFDLNLYYLSRNYLLRKFNILTNPSKRSLGEGYTAGENS